MRYDHLNMLPVNAFMPIGKRMTLEGKGSAPKTPDYTAAAQATAQGNLEATRAAAAANRVNQYTPYGSLVYSQSAPNTFNQQAYDQAMKQYQASQSSPAGNANFSSTGLDRLSALYGPYGGNSSSSVSNGNAPNMADFYTSSNPDNGWSATTTLSPAQQAILDQTNQLNLGLNQTANQGLQYANSVLSKPGVDTSQLPQVGINPGQSYQDAMMARLQPQIDRENQQSDAQLANQGITQGSQAYINAKTLLNQQHNDLLNNATVQGFNTGLNANQNAFQQQAYNQMQPINVINALRTGSQVQNPNFTNVPQQQTTGGSDIMGATQNTYNSNLASSNAQNAQSANMMSGLMSLGGMALMSDRRLKENIVKIGQLDNGLNLYSYEYKKGHELPEGKQVGVMADEVEKLIPEAIVMRADGYKQVDYARIL